MNGGDAIVGRAYDAIAAEYDGQLAGDPGAQDMRARLHKHFRRVFRTGDRVLDLTAGTGIDACYLAASGVRVTAIDISPGMIAELKRRAAPYGPFIQARVLAAECLDHLDAGAFDGAISTFAGLNTIEDLPRLARDLARRLRPRGSVIIHALSSRCWRRNTFRAGFSAVRIGGQLVDHHAYDPFVLWRAVFAAHFDLRQVYAMSMLATPRLIARMPGLARGWFALDRACGRLFPASGEFFVLELSKRD